MQVLTHRLRTAGIDAKACDCDDGQTQGHSTMPLTRDFDETVKARVGRDPEFRENLLREAVGALLDGEIEVGKALTAEASATDAELLDRLEDEADLAILRERLADVEISGYIPHALVIDAVGE